MNFSALQVIKNFSSGVANVRQCAIPLLARPNEVRV